MPAPSRILIAHALETAPGAALRRQADLYRAIAALTPDRTERARLEALAAGCDALLAQHAAHAAQQRELLLTFKKTST